MNSKIIKRIILGVAILLAALYVGVQIYNQFKPGISTETAVHASVTDSLRVDGTIIRKETLLKNKSSGIISYEVSDGAKVAQDGTIATVYSNAEAAAAESKKLELKEQLAQLESLEDAASTAAVNPDNINKQIYQKLYSLKTDINDFSLSDITSDRNDTLNLINQWQLATGKAKTFSSRIQSLKQEISSLTSSSNSATGTIKATAAGYFVKEIDGYESAYDYSKVTQLTVDDIKQKKTAASTQDDSIIGKICEEFDWYIVCVVPADTALKLSVDDEITIELPFASSDSIPVKVAAINQADTNSEAAVILKCSYMNATLASIRNETVLLNIDQYDGIKISQQAIHFETVTGEITDEDGNTTTVTKEVRGVYVVDGSELKFVQIVPVYTTGNYVICDPSPDQNEILTDSTISLYDNVAIGGNLYDGKSVG